MSTGNPPSYSEALRSLMDSVRIAPNPDIIDVVLMLNKDFESLKLQCDKYPMFTGNALNRIAGLPIEGFDTEFEMHERSFELAKNGKRCLVCK